MKFDRAEEEAWQRDLVGWLHNPGTPDLSKIDTQVRILAVRMQENADIAAFHFDLIKEAADRFPTIESCQLAMVDCYRRGHGVQADATFAWSYLSRALATGRAEAKWWHANFLVDNKGLEEVISPDPARALEIYRDLAWDESDLTILSLARKKAVPLLIEGKHSGQLSSEDEELVRQYASNWQEMNSAHYYELALFYSRGLRSTNHAGPEYATARRLLIDGMTKSRSEAVRRKCEELLDAWEVKPKPPEPMTTKEKIAAGADVAAGVGGFVVGQFFWAAAAVAFFAVTAWINLFIAIPLIIVIGLVCVLGGGGKRQRE